MKKQRSRRGAWMRRGAFEGDEAEKKTTHRRRDKPHFNYCKESTSKMPPLPTSLWFFDFIYLFSGFFIFFLFIFIRPHPPSSARRPAACSQRTAEWHKKNGGTCDPGRLKINFLIRDESIYIYIYIYIYTYIEVYKRAFKVSSILLHKLRSSVDCFPIINYSCRF